MNIVMGMTNVSPTAQVEELTLSIVATMLKLPAPPEFTTIDPLAVLAPPVQPPVKVAV
jgi:hypothetical protein